jgi:vancomycin permeability regulator SanA
MTKTRTSFHRLTAHLLRLVLLAAAGLACAVPLATAYVANNTAGYRFTSVDDIPVERVAIVFGAGIRPDGRLSRILADRVDAAIELYRAGRVAKLLMTGDNSQVDYDEVSAMRRYAAGRGIPEEDITLDYAGFRTYDSCYRARAIFGVERAVLVTQRYHLPRAVYTCRVLGIDAVGLGTPDWEAYPDRAIAIYTMREVAATFVALLEVHVTRPLPRFLGPFEGIP